MDKIKFITDSASDIPDEMLAEYQIDMCNIPITVDGEGYYERKSFTTQEFYKLLGAADEIPVTSRVPMDDFLACYQKAWEQGHSHIIHVTLNAGGSGINASAQMARERFYQKTPEARDKIGIHIVDSRTYSFVYGYPVVQGAKMARAGKSAEEILAYIEDYFDRVEIYLGCYSLEYAKRSGRIGAAAAFVGDVLGLRPIISMIDGQTKTVDKVRGDKNLPARLLQLYLDNRAGKEGPVLIVRGELDAPVEELQALLREDLGRDVQDYYAGASIAINTGPKLIAVVCLGKRRPQPSK